MAKSTEDHQQIPIETAGTIPRRGHNGTYVCLFQGFTGRTIVTIMGGRLAVTGVEAAHSWFVMLTFRRFVEVSEMLRLRK